MYKYAYIYAYRISLLGARDTRGGDGGKGSGGGEGLKGVQTDTAIELPTRRA